MSYKDIVKEQLAPLRIYKEDAIIHATDIEVHAKQLDAAEDSINGLEVEVVIKTATEAGITFREQLYGINPINMTLEERRTNVLAKSRGGQGCTPELIKLSALAYGHKVEIIENFADYDFVIRFIDEIGIPSNMTDVRAVMNELKPAHLQVYFRFKYLVISEMDTLSIAELETMTLNDFENYQ